MGKKKDKKLAKYKPVREGIDTQDAVMKAIISLDIAGMRAQSEGDTKAMALVGLGWAVLSGPVHDIESTLRAQLEVAELQSETERVINKVGFSPISPWEDEDDED